MWGTAGCSWEELEARSPGAERDQRFSWRVPTRKRGKSSRESTLDHLSVRVGRYDYSPARVGDTLDIFGSHDRAASDHSSVLASGGNALDRTQRIGRVEGNLNHTNAAVDERLCDFKRFFRPNTAYDGDDGCLSQGVIKRHRAHHYE